MAAPPVATRCPICGRRLQRGQLYCSLDVIMLARRATRAYELARHRHASWDERRLRADALAWLDSGHADHQSPRLGCAFCILVP